MKTIALVTIRLNSKRVPQKNIKPLGGKPMCWHAVNTLLQVREIDAVYIYCSESAIKDCIPEKAIFLQRDRRLDGDEIKAKDTYGAFVKEIDADIYVAVCSTSPFMKAKTVSEGIQKIQSGAYDSAFTVKRAQTFAWHKGQPLNYDPADVLRTQDIEPVFIETSAFYAFKKEVWTKHGRRTGFAPYMCEVDDIEAIDIDTPEDFAFAETIMRIFEPEGTGGRHVSV
jgi:CMP-N-acetylneuraminic acid synthetase